MDQDVVLGSLWRLQPYAEPVFACVEHTRMLWAASDDVQRVQGSGGYGMCYVCSGSEQLTNQ